MERLKLASRIVLLAALSSTSSAQAQVSEEDDLAQAYGDKSFVTIATGSRVAVTRAPAVASVITAEDIAALGASDLDQVLETVPGLHVSRSTAVFYNPAYTIRGIRGGLTNPQVLMLVNGLPLTTVFSGDRGSIWGGMPTENIARIEVIRGPGSALYGADAFSGVINIITKTAAEIDGTEIGGRVGSFKSGDAWLLHGGKLGALDVAGYLRLGSTQGAKPTISADAQTGWDAVFASNASHAPGAANLGRNALDGSLDLAHGQWRLRAAYKQRNHGGSGTGIAQALDPTGSSYSERFASDLSYRDREFAKHWDILLQANFVHYREESDIMLFPAGAFGGMFPDGMFGAPYKWERQGRLSLSASYSGFAAHRLRAGFGGEKLDLYKIRERKNFTQVPALAYLGSVVDVSDSNPFMRPHRRQVRYVYAQDEWSAAPDWTLTAGIRHDDYSDFGGTTNPRLALVWEAAYNLTAKLLYGSAFRAPSFTELYSINNPVNIGSPSLQPEKMQTVEAAIAWQPTAKLELGLNVFRYRMRDIIRLVGTTYQNAGRQTGHGLEFEAGWDATKALRLSGNYGYQRSTDQASSQDPGMAPRHRLFLRSDWRVAYGWLLNTRLNWVGERRREPGDTRPDLKDYTTIDLTLGTRRGRGRWDVAFIARNLFDADAREPSAFTISPTQPFNSIPNDLPLSGRAFDIQASYRL